MYVTGNNCFLTFKSLISYFLGLNSLELLAQWDSVSFPPVLSPKSAPDDPSASRS